MFRYGNLVGDIDDGSGVGVGVGYGLEWVFGIEGT